jgi:hypothetical protein
MLRRGTLLLVAVMAVLGFSSASPASAGWDWYCQTGQMCVLDTDPQTGGAGNWNDDNHYEDDILNNYETVNNNINYVANRDVCSVEMFQHGNWWGDYNQWMWSGYDGWVTYQDVYSSHAFYC